MYLKLNNLIYPNDVNESFGIWSKEIYKNRVRLQEQVFIEMDSAINQLLCKFGLKKTQEIISSSIETIETTHYQKSQQHKVFYLDYCDKYSEHLDKEIENVRGKYFQLVEKTSEDHSLFLGLGVDEDAYLECFSETINHLNDYWWSILHKFIIQQSKILLQAVITELKEIYQRNITAEFYLHQMNKDLTLSLTKMEESRISLNNGKLTELFNSYVPLDTTKKKIVVSNLLFMFSTILKEQNLLRNLHKIEDSNIYGFIKILERFCQKMFVGSQGETTAFSIRKPDNNDVKLPSLSSMLASNKLENISQKKFDNIIDKLIIQSKTRLHQSLDKLPISLQEYQPSKQIVTLCFPETSNQRLLDIKNEIENKIQSSEESDKVGVFWNPNLFSNYIALCRDVHTIPICYLSNLYGEEGWYSTYKNILINHASSSYLHVHFGVQKFDNLIPRRKEEIRKFQEAVEILIWGQIFGLFEFREYQCNNSEKEFEMCYVDDDSTLQYDSCQEHILVERLLTFDEYRQKLKSAIEENIRMFLETEMIREDEFIKSNYLYLIVILEYWFYALYPSLQCSGSSVVQETESEVLNKMRQSMFEEAVKEFGMIGKTENELLFLVEEKLRTIHNWTIPVATKKGQLLPFHPSPPNSKLSYTWQYGGSENLKPIVYNLILEHFEEDRYEARRKLREKNKAEAFPRLSLRREYFLPTVYSGFGA